MDIDQKIIQPKIAELVEAKNIKKEHAYDIAFHLTDWLEDLDAFYKLINNFKSYSAKDANKILTDFLIHVPEHIAAAKKLYIGEPTEDVFEVGAVKEN